MKKKPLTTKSGEVRPLTKDDFATMRPLHKTDPEFLTRFEQEKRLRGRPAGRNKTVVSISMDRDLLEKLRDTGSGWQSRVNALLRAAMGLSESSSASS